MLAIGDILRTVPHRVADEGGDSLGHCLFEWSRCYLCSSGEQNVDCIRRADLAAQWMDSTTAILFNVRYRIQYSFNRFSRRLIGRRWLLIVAAQSGNKSDTAADKITPRTSGNQRPYRRTGKADLMQWPVTTAEVTERHGALFALPQGTAWDSDRWSVLS